MTPRTETATIISALRVLSREIYSEDGVANACILEGAERIAELQARVKELEEALRPDEFGACPICRRTVVDRQGGRHNHAPRCGVARALSGAKP